MTGEDGAVVGTKRSWEVSKRGGEYELELGSHVKRERAAVKLAGAVGELLFERSVELVLFRNHLVDTTTSEILKFHEYAAKVVQRPVDVFTTCALAQTLSKLELAPSKLDLGKLADEWLQAKAADDSADMEAFLRDKLADFMEGTAAAFEPRDVVLYGFGRIGRLAARMLILGAGKGQQLRLRAVVTRDKNPEDIVKRAGLFSNDSTHGAFRGCVEADVENQCLCINGQIVKMISASSPEEIDYTAFGIKDALVIDNTGALRDEEGLGRHLKSKGVAKVLLTAPGKGVPNVVYGINEGTVDLEKNAIVSAASCTTNAISPVLKVVDDFCGVVRGHVETIHSYTNDQNLLDNFHKKSRRGRSAAVNMVITETGAAQAVPRIIPSLQGKLTANAVRVPTPNASLAILNLQLGKAVTVAEINNAIREASIRGGLVNQIHYSIDPEMVSNDVIGNECCSVFDSHATMVGTDPSNVILYTFYDNEFGYTKQVIRLAKHITGVRRRVYY